MTSPGTDLKFEQRWPKEASDKYDRLEVLGKGSFGMVWMARRVSPPEDQFDDDYVAIKTIHIKNEKGEVYAEREIKILHELRHPHVIRLIRSYNMNDQDAKKRFPRTQLVVMQLARGPNLHQIVIKRGALGLPLARQVSRELIAAVSYLHGRAVIHRDIKPSNCILARTSIDHTDFYDWLRDDAIWSSKQDGIDAVRQQRWKLMLVDFGFARAIEREDLELQTKKMRNSILFESHSSFGSNKKLNPTVEQDSQEASEFESKEAVAEQAAGGENAANGQNDSDDDTDDDMARLEEMAGLAAEKIKPSFQANNKLEDAIMGTGQEKRRRTSFVSVPFQEIDKKTDVTWRRASTTRRKFLSMSALGTKAYAAPEIRKQLRPKNTEDFIKANAAMTECVADYGMIVDAYSVGWTLRVAMTGVPPDYSVSEYMQKRVDVVMIQNEDDDNGSYDEGVVGCCCCFAMPAPKTELIKIRNPTQIPYDATLLIAQMTEKQPEDRMTVREAQLHPWIAGNDDEEKYFIPQGDVPSNHGDPVVPLMCAPALSKITMDYHMSDSINEIDPAG